MSRRTPKKHHLFLHWLKNNRRSFPFEPQILKVSRRSIRGQFIGVTSAIQFVLTQSGIVISARWKGECWDLIGELDVPERNTDKGYYNGLGLPEWIVYYPTREAVWRLESFEKFLTWCHKTLATSQYLALYEYSGVTQAKLLKNRDNDRDCQHRLALIEIIRDVEVFRRRIDKEYETDQARAGSMPQGESVCGEVIELRVVITSRSSLMAFAKVKTNDEIVEAIIFPESYRSFKDLLSEPGMLEFSGQLKMRDDGFRQMLVEKVQKI